MRDSLRDRTFARVMVAGAALSGLLVVAVIGFSVIEGLSLIDAVYMAVITLSTVGFGEVKPLSPVGRLFTIGLIIGGGGLAAYTLSTAAEYIASGEWRAQWQGRRQRQMQDQLHQHVIVCGYGRVGRYVARELEAEHLPFIVIDPDPAQFAKIKRDGYLALQGNAANEHDLDRAGIQRARGLIAAASSDAENVFIVLTARGVNPSLSIAARANFEESEAKLLRAGANRVLLPYRIGGRRLVTMLVRPDAADFLDEVVHAGGLELVLEQIGVGEGSPLAGLTLPEARDQSLLEVEVLACKSPDSPLRLRPPADTRIEVNSQLIALGTHEQLWALMQQAGHPGRRRS